MGNRSLGGMKTTRLVILSLLFLMLATIVWISARPRPPVVIIGAMSAKDVAGIKVAVRGELHRRILPRVSWHDFKQLPGSIRVYSRIKIKLIQAESNDRVIVLLGPEEPGQGVPTSPIYLDEQMIVFRGTNGWQAIGSPIYDGL